MITRDLKGKTGILEIFKDFKGLGFKGISGILREQKGFFGVLT